MHYLENYFFQLWKFLAMLFGFCVCATNHWLKILLPWSTETIEIVVVKRSLGAAAAAVTPPLLS